MIDPKIQRYIEVSRQKGKNDEEIKKSLLSSGWSQDKVDEAMSISAHETNTKTNVFAILSIIFAILFPLVGLIFGIIGLNQIKKSGEKGKGLATAGIVLSAVLMLISLLLIPIAMMAYSGVLSPTRMLPERCTSTPGLDCIDRANIQGHTTQIALRNSIGYPILIENVESENCENFEILLNNEQTSEIPNNSAFQIKLIGCNNGRATSQMSDTIIVTYKNTETGLKHNAQVEIRGKVS